MLAWLDHSSPARRARVLAALCLAPLATGLALVGLCLLPSLSAALWPALDHCTAHADEHLHLCLVHPPDVALGAVAQIAAAAVLVVVLVRGVPGVVRLVRAHLVLARLRRVSSPAPPDLRSVDTDAAFSFTGGLLRPDIYLSRGLRDGLDPAQLAAVIEHERAHVRRRDILRRHAARLGVLFHGPATGRALLAALDLACEEACDEEAATHLGDRVRVAQAIVAAARIAPRPPPALAAGVVGFTVDALTHRVTTLLDSPRHDPAWPRGIAAGAVLLLVVLSPAMHHAIETVLSLLANP
jgi:Zn-dependent protease with chaperone function